MSFQKARNIICIILCAVTALGAVLTVGAFIFSSTLCSSEFMEKRLMSKAVISKCDESYNARLEALSQETGIPVHVFKAASDKFVIAENAVQRLYSGQDTTMFSNDKTEVFEKLCTEYVEGNELKYSKNEITAAAEKATQIYADCYGIADSQPIYDFITSLKNRSSGIMALGLLLIVVPAAVAMMLFSKHEKLLAQLLSFLTASGFAITLSGAVGLIFGIGTNTLITPEIYAKAISQAVRFDFAVILIIGIAVSAAAIFFAVKTNDRIIEKRIEDSL